MNMKYKLSRKVGVGFSPNHYSSGSNKCLARDASFLNQEAFRIPDILLNPNNTNADTNTDTNAVMNIHFNKNTINLNSDISLDLEHYKAIQKQENYQYMNQYNQFNPTPQPRLPFRDQLALKGFESIKSIIFKHTPKSMYVLHYLNELVHAGIEPLRIENPKLYQVLKGVFAPGTIMAWDSPVGISRWVGRIKTVPDKKDLMIEIDKLEPKKYPYKNLFRTHIHLFKYCENYFVLRGSLPKSIQYVI